jgi:non-ribosomal peptide synthetase component F
MLPVRLAVQPELSFVQHVQRVAAQVRAAEQHRHLSLSEMIQLLNPARDQSRSAIFTAAFSHQSAAPAMAFGTLQTRLAGLPASGARYDLDLTLAANADGAQLVCDYSTELYAPETIGRWLDGLTVLLAAALDDPAAACGVLPMLTAQERQRLLWDWNGTDRAYPHDLTVLDLILRQAQAQPEAPAVRYGESGYRYGELVSRVDALAGRLEQRGVARGDRVGIVMERSADLPAALLAVWRVGAAYVPLDPSFPPKRLAFMLDDSCARAPRLRQSMFVPRDLRTAPTSSIPPAQPANPRAWRSATGH